MFETIVNAIIPSQNLPQVGLRAKKAAKVAEAGAIVFPSDLKSGASNYPFMTIEIVEYPVNNKALLKDLESSSSPIGPTKAGPPLSKGDQIAADVFSTKNIRTQSDGATPQAKGKVLSTIALPIPQHVQNSLHMNWEMQEFAGGKALIQGIKDIGGNLGNVMAGGGSLFDAGKASAQAAMTAVKAEAIYAASSLLQRTVNIIANPKKQAFFNGVEARAFQFDWVLTPTTQAEAQTIITIIQTMTKYALPALEADSLVFNFPMEFDITFVGVKGFPEFDTMVCVGLETNYTPNMLQLLTTGHPVQIVLSAAFLETTLRTQQYPGIMGATKAVNPTTATKNTPPSSNPIPTISI